MLLSSFNCVQKSSCHILIISLQSVCFDSGEYKWLLYIHALALV